MKYAVMTLALVAAATLSAGAAPNHMAASAMAHPMKTHRPAMATLHPAKKPPMKTPAKRPSPMATRNP